MMKKVLYGVSMALLALVAIGSLQSCKDDLSDFKHEYAFDQNQLGQQIDALDQTLTALKSDYDAKIPALEGRVAKNEGDIAALQALVAALADKTVVETLQTDLGNLKTDFDAYKAGNDAKIEAIKTDVAGINANITTLNSTMADHEARIAALETGLADANAKITGLLTTVATQATQIETIQGKLTELETALGDKADKTALKELSEKVTALETKLDTEVARLDKKIDDIKAALEKKDAELEKLIKDLEPRVVALEKAVDAIKTRLDNMANRMDVNISGILIQGTDNPLFGNFSLPIGVKSNMLFNWYGKNGSVPVKFPSAAGIADEKEAAAYATLLGTLKPQGEVEIGANEYYGDVNLGKVYMTINPVGVDFSGASFYVETSKGEEGRLPVTITPDASDEELYFGYTRSEANGFYESSLVIPASEANIAKAEVPVDENLKPAMKEVLENRSLRSAANLLKTLYNQMVGVLPAYALRADWTYTDDKGVEQSASVLSQYDLAVATAQPLSYNFLAGKGTSKKVPTIGHMSNFIYELKNNGNLHFDFSSNVTFDKYTFKMPAIEITAPDKVDPNDLKVSVNIGDVTVLSNKKDPVTNKFEPIGTAEIGTISADVTNLTNVINNKIIASVQKMVTDLQGWPAKADESISNQINDLLNNTVAKKIDQMMSDISGQINDKIDNLIDDLGGKADPFFKRVNKVFDIYNRVADKVNSFLADPNAYLQVAAFYINNKKDFGVLSCTPSDPTIFYAAGGNAIELYLSSYTGEFVVPAYKKYVAITGVVNEANADVKSLNEGELNTVIDGSRIRIAVPTGKLTAGKTYELTYQGLDYSGMISTKKFYIKIK